MLGTKDAGSGVKAPREAFATQKWNAGLKGQGRGQGAPWRLVEAALSGRLEECALSSHGRVFKAGSGVRPGLAPL